MPSMETSRPLVGGTYSVPLVAGDVESAVEGREELLESLGTDEGMWVAAQLTLVSWILYLADASSQILLIPSLRSQRASNFPLQQ